jgi:2-desacetyl-2-hydroxyethyl bacteriochlorophyllide A dehydrogenase
MVLTAPGEMSLEEVPVPQPAAGQVLVRISHSGLCGTDVKIYKGAIPARYPLIMGHEMIGEVMEGDMPSGIRAGDRVIIDPVLFCGACFHCRIGQTSLCPNGGLIGRETNGGFAQYACVPATNVFLLPASIDSRTAPLIQVATTCLHGQRLTPFFMGESVAVIGLGVSGQLHVQLARARGAGQVIGISRSAFKNDLARQLGADLTIGAGSGAVAEVLEATGGRGPDVVIETTGVLASLADAIQMVRFGGRILMFGILSETTGGLPLYQLYFKELTLLNTRAATGRDFPETIDLVERGALRLDPLITHRMPLGGLETALGMVGDRMDGRLKIILDHN